MSGEGSACIHPCTPQPIRLKYAPDDPICNGEVVSSTTLPPMVATTTKKSETEQKTSGGWPWFVWLLIIAAALAISCALVYGCITVFANKAPKKGRKKRGDG